MSRARKEREERGRVCRRRSVTGEYVKEAVRGEETSSVFFFSPSSSMSRKERGEEGEEGRAYVAEKGEHMSRGVYVVEEGGRV